MQPRGQRRRAADHTVNRELCPAIAGPMGAAIPRDVPLETAGPCGRHDAGEVLSSARKWCRKRSPQFGANRHVWRVDESEVFRCPSRRSTVTRPAKATNSSSAARACVCRRRPRTACSTACRRFANCYRCGLPVQPASRARGRSRRCESSTTPRYEYRGVMLDIARHYEPPSAVEQLIDQASAYKINVLHRAAVAAAPVVAAPPACAPFSSRAPTGSGGRRRSAWWPWTAGSTCRSAPSPRE